MSHPPRTRSAWSPEWALVLLVPVVTLVAGAVMLHVASRFGFTALGEPVPVSVGAAAAASR
jgi:hypothetical protein